MTDKELEEQMLKLMTEKERETYWKKKLGALLYSKYGHMSNKERAENGVWFQDEQGMKDD